MRRLHKYKFNSSDKKHLKIRLNNKSSYFINVLFCSLIKKGLKQKIFLILCRAIYNIKLNWYFRNKKYLSTLRLFRIIFHKLNSKIFLKPRHIGKTKYIVPIISTHNSINLAVGWFLRSMRIRKERTLYLRLYNELKDILDGTSPVVNEKQKYYKIAFDNKINLKILKFIN